MYQALRDQQVELHRQRHEEEIAHLKRIHAQELANQGAALSPQALAAIIGGGSSGENDNMPASLREVYRGTASSTFSCFSPSRQLYP